MRIRKVYMNEEPITERGEIVYKTCTNLTKKRQKTFAFDKKLIEAVRKKEVIYNPAKKSNRYGKQKEEAWVEIASELKVAAKRCKTRWGSLRDRYRRITKQQEQTVQHGMKFTNKWRYYNPLNFLSQNPLSNPVSDPISEPISTPVENQSQNHEVFTVIPYSAIDHLQRTGRGTPLTKVEILNECDPMEEFSTPTYKQGFTNNVCVKNNATSLFFMSLAKRIQTANLPPLTQMKLEADILCFTINKIEQIKKQSV